MRLAVLSTAERIYLNRPLPEADTLTPFLVRHFSRVLGARMKQCVRIHAGALDNHDFAAHFLVDTDAPEIRWDSALDAMWLRGRLGGRSCAPCSAMTKNLLRTLQLGLAETWISLPGTQTLPAALALRVEIAPDKISGGPAVLVIRFPSSLTRMNRWAQHIIRHAN